MSYKVVRFYFNKPGYRRTIKNKLTLEQAQEHCKSPETSSSTCTMRWGVKTAPVLTWMKARGFRHVMDLMKFSLDHATAMNMALNDFWEFST